MRRPDGPYSFWEMKERAARLWESGKDGRREIMRHAHVSIDNRHKCRECFTCACAEVWQNQGRIDRP